MQQLRKPSVLSSSSATSVYGYGWMGTLSRRTTCSATVRSWPVSTRSPLFSTLKLDKWQQIGSGQRFPASMRTAITTSPAKKGYPRFQHDNRSVEYKTTGWKIEPDGKHITFTDGCGIGTLRLVGNKKQAVATFPVKQIKRVRIVRRADGYYCQVRRFGVSKIAPKEQEVESKRAS